MVKFLMFLLNLVNGAPPKEESLSWVAERDDNYGRETKDKAVSDAGK